MEEFFVNQVHYPFIQQMFVEFLLSSREDAKINETACLKRNAIEILILWDVLQNNPNGLKAK